MQIRINAIDCTGLNGIIVRPRNDESIIEACERIANVYTHGMARTVWFSIEVDGQPMTHANGTFIKVAGRP